LGETIEAEVMVRSSRLLLCALLVGAISCGPATTGGGDAADSGLSAGDAGHGDAVALDGGGGERPLVPPDAGTADTVFWSEDAGVAYESYLPCLSGAAITLASCFEDARGRALAVAPLGLPFARAVGSFDSNGEVPADRPGLVYQFCRPDGALYECISVEYWWSGVTAQISLLRLHAAREGPGRTRDPGLPPDSPAIMGGFLAVPDCDLGAAGYADINLFAEEDSDRIRVVSASDTLLLDDPSMTILENQCSP